MLAVAINAAAPSVPVEERGAGAGISIRNLRKTYGAFAAIDDVTIDIEPGEFIALLGPSGSGKSTILMSVAGFETPTSGEILLDGVPITRLPPHKRDIGVVFQRYALFPHMTVADNVAYPLRRRGEPQETIGKEVERALAMVGLAHLGARYPSQLSGGQQQRVALARAMVFRPPVLLMDEPLGALDRKLRQQMQLEISRLHRKLGATVLFVTHDQEEALSMADRVAVLNNGRLCQLGTPAELYRAPKDAFVANFIGETNLFPAVVNDAGGEAVSVQLIGTKCELKIPKTQCLTTAASALLGIRPEHLAFEDHPNSVSARVLQTAFGGATNTIVLDIAGAETKMILAGDTACPRDGELVPIRIDPQRCRLYASE